MKRTCMILMTFACLAASFDLAQAKTVEKQTAEGIMKIETSGAAANDWAEMTVAGYLYQPDHLALAWHFGFDAKVADLAKVEVWDITKAPAVKVLAQDPIKLEDKKWYAATEYKDITFKSEPWLTDRKPTERIYKIIMTNSKGETKTLYQLATYDRKMKDGTVQLMKGKYVHVQGKRE